MILCQRPVYIHPVFVVLGHTTLLGCPENDIKKSICINLDRIRYIPIRQVKDVNCGVFLLLALHRIWFSGMRYRHTDTPPKRVQLLAIL